MIMSKSKYVIIHEKAIRLIEGGVVEVDGLFVKAIEVDSVDECCEICTMDCLCVSESHIFDVCAECNRINRYNYCLKLVNEN